MKQITTWGFNHFGAAAPKYIKYLFVMLIAPAVATALANITEFGLSEKLVHIIQIFSPVIGAFFQGVRELFGTKIVPTDN
jgi:hypothetical protein